MVSVDAVKSLGNVATVVLGLVCLSFFLFLHVITDKLDDGEIRSLCGSHRLLSDSLCIEKYHSIIPINSKRNV